MVEPHLTARPVIQSIDTAITPDIDQPFAVFIVRLDDGWGSDQYEKLTDDICEHLWKKWGKG